MEEKELREVVIFDVQGDIWQVNCAKVDGIIGEIMRKQPESKDTLRQVLVERLKQIEVKE